MVSSFEENAPTTGLILDSLLLYLALAYHVRREK